jgi:uncharacterized membrane protein (DUF2068 family)
MTAMTRPPRPTGVAIIGILEIILGVVFLLAGVVVAAIGESGFFTSYGYGEFSGLEQVAGVLIAVAGLVAVGIGWGIWSGKTWAWYLAVIFYFLGALLALVQLAGQSYTAVVSLLIDLLLLWYFFRPHVKAYFGRGASAPPVQAVPTMQPAQPQPSAAP